MIKVFSCKYTRLQMHSYLVLMMYSYNRLTFVTRRCIFGNNLNNGVEMFYLCVPTRELPWTLKSKLFLLKVIRRLRKLSCKKLNLKLDAIKTARICTKRETEREREREKERNRELERDADRDFMRRWQLIIIFRLMTKLPWGITNP